MGYKLNIKNPKTYSEKLQWTKLYDHNPLYTVLVDKLSVKQIVKNIVGGDCVIPTLVEWNDVDEISIDSLPDQFVLKTNNGGGSNGVIVCRDKKSFDLLDAKNKINKSLKSNIYMTHREWPYKNVRPKIFAEQYVVDESGYELKDYKFFCFNGKVKALFVATDRYKGEENVRFDYYDSEFNHLDLRQSHLNSSHPMKTPPKNFDEMKRVAEALSIGLRHVRVDLYNVNGRILFGEMTFFHYSGLVPFIPSEWDRIWGEWIEL